MSELINNRQTQLKELIHRIHDGLNIDEAKQIFKREFGTISTEEIVELEESLISDGMSVKEVQRLCDVHAAVFDGSIEDIHRPKDITQIPGHPAYVLREENKRILALIQNEIEAYPNLENQSHYLMVRIGLERLQEIHQHYARKEYLIFPILEKKGIESIPQVMWGVDNDIRDKIKSLLLSMNDKATNLEELSRNLRITLTMVKDMVTKEENILLPKLTQLLTYYDWIMIDKGSDDIGYFLEAPKQKWAVSDSTSPEEAPAVQKTTDTVSFDAGKLSSVELNAILNTVPFDMTFVDKDGLVKYFTQGKERVFQRPLSVIGRSVSMCHPPKSVHIVEEIIESFKSGKKDHEDFHIQMKDKFVHIRYYAIRDNEGAYLGTLEVTQDILPLRLLEGEKRLIG